MTTIGDLTALLIALSAVLTALLNCLRCVTAWRDGEPLPGLVPDVPEAAGNPAANAGGRGA